MIHQDDDIAIDKYNYLKDMLVSTIERKLHQVRYVNMMKDDIKREIEIGSGVKFKIDKGELHFIINLLILINCQLTDLLSYCSFKANDYIIEFCIPQSLGFISSLLFLCLKSQ